MSEDLLHHMSDVACVRAWEDEGWGPFHMRLLTMAMSLESQGFKTRNGMTQHQKILRHIKENGSITQREAFIDYSIQSFTKRISELRDMGYEIRGERRKHPVTKQEYTRYSLAA